MKKLILILLMASVVQGAGWYDTNDTTVNHFYWIKTATMNYCSACNDNLTVAGFIAEHYDLSVNGGPEAIDTFDIYNSTMKTIRYVLLTSLRDEDTDTIPQYAIDNSITTEDSIYEWVSGDSICVIGSGATCATDTTCSNQGDTLAFCGWTVPRNAADFMHSETVDYFLWKAIYKISSDGLCDGVMEDEAHVYYGGNHMMFPFFNTGQAPELVFTYGTTIEDAKGWTGYTHEEAMDTLQMRRCDTGNAGAGWSKVWVDSLHALDYGYFPNITVAGRIQGTVRDAWWPIKYHGGGALIWENSMGPIALRGSNDDGWEMMDSIIAWDTGYAAIWISLYKSDTANLSTDGDNGRHRGQMACLGFYYMAANPDQFYFMLQGNDVSEPQHLANDFEPADTNWKWFAAMEYDVGTPDSSRYVAYNNGDTTVYQRDYTRNDGLEVIMLYRGYVGSTYDATTDITVQLGGNYQELSAIGVLGSVVTSATLRNVEGQIFIEEEAAAASASTTVIQGSYIKGVN